MEETSTENFSSNDITEFNTQIRGLTGSDYFSLYHLNVQRVSNMQKFDRLRRHVGSFDRKPDVLSFVETWFIQNETGEVSSDSGISLYEIEGYQSIFCSRNERSAGVAVYVKEGMNFEVLRKQDGPVSYIHMTLSGIEISQDTIFTFVYMPKLSLTFSFLAVTLGM